MVVRVVLPLAILASVVLGTAMGREVFIPPPESEAYFSPNNFSTGAVVTCFDDTGFLAGTMEKDFRVSLVTYTLQRRRYHRVRCKVLSVGFDSLVFYVKKPRFTGPYDVFVEKRGKRGLKVYKEAVTVYGPIGPFPADPFDPRYWVTRYVPIVQLAGKPLGADGYYNVTGGETVEAVGAYWGAAGLPRVMLCPTAGRKYRLKVIAGSYNVDNQGHGTFRVRVPERAALGKYTLRFDTKLGRASTRLRVVEATD